MKTIAIVLLTVLTAAPSYAGVDEAFDLLARRVAKDEELAAAKQAIRAAYPAGGAECIRRLVDLWSSNVWSRPETLAWACEWADDQTAPIILQAVREKAGSQESPMQDRLRRFFGVDSRVLWERLSNPEPVLELAFDARESLVFYPAPPEMMERWILRDLARRTASETGGGSGGIWITERALPDFFKFAKDKIGTAEGQDLAAVISQDGVQAALATLIEWSYAPVLPVLQQLVDHWPEGTNATLKDYYNLGIAKLKWQDDRTRLREIVRTEREDRRLLRWATWRLLQMREKPEDIKKALRENRVRLTAGHFAGDDLAEALTYTLFGEGPDSFTHPELGRIQRVRMGHEWGFDPKILNAREYADYVRDLRKARSLEGDEAVKIMKYYTYEAVLERAGK